MKLISVWKDYKVRNLSKESEISKLIDSMNLTQEQDIELDLCDCLIAYSATSKIIDHIVNHLKGLHGRKTLKIILTSIDPQEYVLEDLFRGSRCFNWDVIRSSANQMPILKSQAQGLEIELDICKGTD